jgi:hypothetical protein
MTTEEIERDAAHILAASEPAFMSRTPVNKTERVFPASSWLKSLQVQFRALRPFASQTEMAYHGQELSDEASLSDPKIIARLLLFRTRRRSFSCSWLV